MNAVIGVAEDDRAGDAGPAAVLKVRTRGVLRRGAGWDTAGPAGETRSELHQQGNIRSLRNAHISSPNIIKQTVFFSFTKYLEFISSVISVSNTQPSSIKYSSGRQFFFDSFHTFDFDSRY